MRFLYAPNAVLYHDYNNDPEQLEQKTQRYQANVSYLEHCGANRQGLLRMMTKAQSFAPGTFFRHRSFGERSGSETPLSILTTAKNGELFLEDLTYSLKNQTHSNFEFVFVDDASDDQTVARIKMLWKGDSRLKLVGPGDAGRTFRSAQSSRRRSAARNLSYCRCR